MKLRLVVILSGYAFFVCAAMVGLVAMFIVMAVRTANFNANAVVTITMDRNEQIIAQVVQGYEATTKYMAATLVWFFVPDAPVTDPMNLSVFINSWRTMAMSLMSNPQLLIAFEMWQANASDDSSSSSFSSQSAHMQNSGGDDSGGGSADSSSTSTTNWYATGCIPSSQVCFFYDWVINGTYYVPANFLTGIYQVNNYTYDPAPPSFYSRTTQFVGVTYISSLGQWSPMYIDFSNTTTSHVCEGINVLKTMSFYYCMQYFISDEPVDAVLEPCSHLAGTLIESSHLGELQSLVVSDNSEAYLYSLNRVDNTGGICEPSELIRETIQQHLASCAPPPSPPPLDALDSSAGSSSSYLSFLSSLFSSVKRSRIDVNLATQGYTATWEDELDAVTVSSNQTFCDNTMNIGKQYVTTAISVYEPTGFDVVLVDITPRSTFFYYADRGKHISVVISSIVLLLVVVVCVLMWLVIVVPINWICRGMRKATTLTNDSDELKQRGLYTILAEVSDLYGSYLDLRKALMDLKAFVPQGLFVAPESTAMEMNSVFAELIAGLQDGASDSDEYSSSNAADAGEVRLETQNDNALQDDNMPLFGSTTLPHERQRRRHNRSARHDEDYQLHQLDCVLASSQREAGAGASGAAISRGGLSQCTDVSTTGMMMCAASNGTGANTTSSAGANSAVATAPHVASPQSLGRPRSSGSNAEKETEMHNGIVPLISVDGDDDDEVLQNDQDGFHTTSPNVPCGSPAERRRVSFVGKTALQNGGLGGVMMNANGVMAQNNIEPAGSYTHTMPAHSSTTTYMRSSLTTVGEAPSLRLDIQFDGVNKFKNVTCSLMVLAISFRYINTTSLEEEVAKLMNTAVKVILRSGGVIEVFRPDLLAVSFGAHSSQTRHIMLATACAITLSRLMSPKDRVRMHIVVDTGAFFVGNCGAHDRISRVVFGDRFEFCIDLIKYDVGFGRLIVTDRVAVCLPPDMVVPVDYIIPSRNRMYGVQLYHVVDQAARKLKDKEFKAGVTRFRDAYAAAVKGDYAKSLGIINKGRLYDPELGAIFANALKYLMELRPKRPRYCRFQLPTFEPLGTAVKERTAKYQYNRLSLADINNNNGNHNNNNDSAPSINFGFGASGSAFGEEDRDAGNANSASMANIRGDGGADSGEYGYAGSAQLPALNMINSGGSRAETNFPISRPGGGVGQGTSLAMNGNGADVELTGLPQCFVDHQGEMWHRMPKPIGSGAFADVYLGISQTGVLMALKCIRLSANNVNLEDVVSEVNTACKLFHDHIVHHAGWAHLGPYLILIMDYMSAGTLKSAMNAFPNGMTVQVAKRYALASLKGLAYLHKHNIVHADLKPQNILLAADGTCKISDFGSSLSKASAAAACANDVFSLRGTALYMSPEVAAGAAPSMRSDMWSFGITLYEMLTGRLPWKMMKEKRRRKRKSRTASHGALNSVMFLAGADEGSNARGLDNAAKRNGKSDLETVQAGGVTEREPTNTESVSIDMSALAPPPRVDTAAASDMARMMGVTKLNGADEKNETTKALVNEHSSSQLMNAKNCSGNFEDDTDDVSSSVGAGELVDASGLSDVRFVQGLAVGTIMARVIESDLPSREAYDIISLCLRVDPDTRPRASELVDHPFFIM